MAELILNGKDLQTIEQLHQYVKEQLDFPDYDDTNMDSLFNCLTEYVTVPLTIKWLHFNESLNRLGQRANFVAGRMRDAAKSVDGLEFQVE
ncbi:barstar family protein [Metabacillus iocasae]|uniref:Ribonuclease inhibitor n=1 Tax=Priestia iocasae TaxID=2291674 RepID=A0ABS2QSF4_9BACI|nr:barstar family protein [Metabacillus iocasae]MBM7702384.1 ribonuclease inhibitor [Metabacillus iocasae]